MMPISVLIAFLTDVKEEFGNIRVRLHITDCTDSHAPIEKFVDIDDVTASKSRSIRTNNIEQYVKIHGEIK